MVSFIETSMLQLYMEFVFKQKRTYPDVQVEIKNLNLEVIKSAVYISKVIFKETLIFKVPPICCTNFITFGGITEGLKEIWQDFCWNSWLFLSHFNIQVCQQTVSLECWIKLFSPALRTHLVPAVLTWKRSSKNQP